MALTSPRFSKNKRLQSAAENKPPMRSGEAGEAVRILQQALIDLGYRMPISTKRSGSPDGIYGKETAGVAKLVQGQYGLSVDGVAGKNTLHKLDELLQNPAPPPPTGMPYMVPGMKVVLAQPSSMACWATVYTMMISWKRQQSMGIRQAVNDVDPKYAKIYDDNTGLPSTEFKPFLNAAGMSYEPMANLMIEAWVDLLRAYGLLWVGTLAGVSPGSGLHSRIIEGMRGDGHADDTYMKIIDPAGGKRYEELFQTFLTKYEGGFIDANSEYYQIRHF